MGWQMQCLGASTGHSLSTKLERYLSDPQEEEKSAVMKLTHSRKAAIRGGPKSARARGPWKGRSRAESSRTLKAPDWRSTPRGNTQDGSRRASPELLLRIERGAGLALRAQLERELRDAIRGGRLRVDTELPSTRVLAADLGLSRGIVVEAYEQLLAEGYLTARQGSATNVAACRPDVERAAPLEPVAAPPRFDFRPGTPDASLFPRRAWLASFRSVLSSATRGALGYPDHRGPAPVRTALSAYLNRARGTVVQADRMVMCTGFTQGFRLVCQALREHGVKSVAIEDPSHAGPSDAIRSIGLTAVPIPVDQHGILVDRLEATDARAVLITPAHQFPTGSVLAPERRAALADWAVRRRAVVIEDDYDAEYRYDREPIGALQGIAPAHVVYIGTASKTLAPALRLGWLALPPNLVAEVARLKHEQDAGSPVLEQLAFADFIEGGELDRHLRKMRLLYRRRRDVLVAALRVRLPRLQVSGIAAGLHLMLALDPGTDEKAIVASAASASVGVQGLALYRTRSRLPPALILGYGAISDSAIGEGIMRLASVLEQHRPPRG